MLPKPKRFVLQDLTVFNGGLLIQSTLYIHTDAEVAIFVNTLAPIEEIEPVGVDHYKIELDPRYCASKDEMSATVAWLREQLEQEFGNTHKPAKRQED